MNEHQARALNDFKWATAKYRLVRNSPDRGLAESSGMLSHYRIDAVNAFVAAVGCGAINGGADGLIQLLKGTE